MHRLYLPTYPLTYLPTYNPTFVALGWAGLGWGLGGEESCHVIRFSTTFCFLPSLSRLLVRYSTYFIYPAVIYLLLPL